MNLFIDDGGGSTGDPNFSSVVALFKFNNGDGATTAIDSSSYASHQSIGSGMQISSAAPKFGASALRLTERGPAGIAVSGARFARSSGMPITLECWFRKGSTQNATSTPPLLQLYDNNGNTLAFAWQYYSPGSTNRLYLRLSGGSPIDLDVPTGAIGGDGYAFLQLVIDSSDNAEWRVGGTTLLTGSIGPWATGGTVRIGGLSYTGGGAIQCDIDEVRATWGVLRPSTPPTSSFPES